MAHTGSASALKSTIDTHSMGISVRKTSMYRTNASPVERRCQKRVPVSLPVRLYLRGEALDLTSSIDVSAGGICIANPGIQLNINQTVKLSFRIGDFDCLTQAMVVHENNERIGLMFAEDLSRECLRQLELLNIN